MKSHTAGHSNRRRLPAGAILGGVLAFGFLVLALLWWDAEREADELESRLARVEEQLQESRLRTSELQGSFRSAKGEAEVARRAADETERALREAELQRELARSEAEQARLDTESAQQEAEQVREEAAAMRKRRQTELDRMQEALAHIVETRRTPMGMVMDLGEDSLLFDFDKATLRPENREILSRIAGVLLASRGYRLYIYGHTDDVGVADYNLSLSGRRAATVADYFVKAGLPKELIESKGYGESSPRALGRTPAARQKNRRVEIGVVDTIIDYRGDLASAAAP